MRTKLLIITFALGTVFSFSSQAQTADRGFSER